MAREMQTLMQMHRWASAFYLLSWVRVRCTAPKNIQVWRLHCWEKNTFYEYILDDPKHFVFLWVRKRIFAHLAYGPTNRETTHNTLIFVRNFSQCTLTSCLKNWIDEIRIQCTILLHQKKQCTANYEHLKDNWMLFQAMKKFPFFGRYNDCYIAVTCTRVVNENVEKNINKICILIEWNFGF